ncbi:Cut8 six-helix bundle-domain-containing protein [Pyronema omphalodes]|nr:Cut8 six-helix bundle-domain-containing protein [Pyronema omphalodes]
MSTLMNPQPFPLHNSPMHSRPRAGGKKRKAEDEPLTEPRSYDSDMDHQMTPIPQARTIKKPRSNVVSGRPLPLSRLLENVDSETVKNILKTVVDRHPELLKEVTELAPRPTPQCALTTLQNYEKAYRHAFPYGGNVQSDYHHNRVRPALNYLLDALSDYTPHFLPPHEAQHSVSLEFLDGATQIIHRLPEWDNPLHNVSKQTAYEEIAKAWILVIEESGKKGAGITLQYGGWDTKIAKHNQESGGRLESVVEAIRQTLQYGGLQEQRQTQRTGLSYSWNTQQNSGLRAW